MYRRIGWFSTALVVVAAQLPSGCDPRGAGTASSSAGAGGTTGSSLGAGGMGGAQSVGSGGQVGAGGFGGAGEGGEGASTDPWCDGWVSTLGGVGFDWPTDIAALSNNGAVVVGLVSPPATFGAGEANELLLGTNGTLGGFFAIFEPDGTFRYGEAPVETFPTSAIGGPGGTYAVVGAFYNTATFAAGTASAITVTHSAPLGWGLFLAEYDGNDAPQWVATLAAPTTKSGVVDPNYTSAVRLSNGEYWIAGTWTGQMAFGVGTPNAFTEETAAARPFILRADATGNFIDAQTYPVGVGQMYLDRMSSDEVVARFHLRGSVTMGAGEPNETALASSSTTADDRVYAYFKSDGTFDHATQRPPAIPNELDLTEQLVAASTGGFYAATSFSVLGILDGDTPQSVSLFGTGGADAVVVKYDSNLNREWYRMISGTPTSNEGAYRAVPMADGGVAVVGTHDGAITLSVGEPDAQTFPAPPSGKSDVFVVRYDAAGNLMFAERGGGLEQETPQRAAATPDGGLVVAGLHQGPTVFDFCEQSDSASWIGDDDVFVLRFKPVSTQP